MAEDKSQVFCGMLSLRDDLLDLSAWTDAERQAVAEHFAGLARLKAEGRLVLCGRAAEMEGPARMAADPLGLVVFRAEDLDEARRIMGDDAAVRAGVMRVRVRPFEIFLND